MIYKKDANFPYPLLTNTSNSYKNCTFDFDINLVENSKEYCFEISYTIDSEFLNGLINSGQAQLVLIIQSKDNKFFILEKGEKNKSIPKSRISLSKRTTIQLLIQAKEEICFKDNNDLNSFYDSFKEDILVSKNSVLGFSTPVIFDGSNSKPLDLFEKKVNPNLKSDIKIELSNETIIIHYKNEGLQFIDSPQSGSLNNPYIYMGLQKALYRFIANNGDGEEVDLESITVPEGLDLKLYNLMTSKMIKEVNMDNIDEIITLISDKILDKYTAAVRRLYSNGN